MKGKPLLVIFFAMIPLCAHAQAFLKAVTSLPPLSKGEMNLQFRRLPEQFSRMNAIARAQGAIQAMNPFSSSESKSPKKTWKWIGFGTFQAAAWAAVFHCGAPKLSVPVLLAVSYVFLF